MEQGVPLAGPVLARVGLALAQAAQVHVPAVRVLDRVQAAQVRLRLAVQAAVRGGLRLAGQVRARVRLVGAVATKTMGVHAGVPVPVGPVPVQSSRRSRARLRTTEGARS